MKLPSCSSSATSSAPFRTRSRRGVLPAFKIGKHWRYRLVDLEEWIVRRRDAA